MPIPAMRLPLTRLPLMSLPACLAAPLLASLWTSLPASMLLAQNPSPPPAVAGTSQAVRPAHVSRYLSAPPVTFTSILLPPPGEGSPEARADLAAVREAQAQRTDAQIRQAQRDDLQEDIFIYANVLGPRFCAADLPRTTALSAHVRNEAGTVTPTLKEHFRRPRPFAAHPEIHPVCEQKPEPSYPSGHAMVGYLEAFTLAQMVPERSADILTRARQYASNRVICGVHYPSDLEASRTAALVEFGALAGTASFQREMQQAEQEVRQALASQSASLCRTQAPVSKPGAISPPAAQP